MKNILLLICISFLMIGCGSKIELEPKTVVKDNYIFINKCEMIITDELLITEKVNIISGENEEEVKKFILDLYIKNKENENKVKTIKTIYSKYQECIKEDKK